MGWLFEPGFFTSAPVHTAVVIGGVVAVVSAAVGIFTVIRGQSFAGHSLADVSTAGGSGALLLGLSPLTGFLAGGILGALSMDAIGVQRVRGRDVATGIVLGAATGCAALFLYLDTTTHAINGATQQILFGSIFTIDPSTVPVVIACSVGAITNSVRKKAIPISTWLGGAVGVPRPVRTKPRTIRMRVKPVVQKIRAGTRVRPPMRTKSWTALPPSIFIRVPSRT